MVPGLLWPGLQPRRVEATRRWRLPCAGTPWGQDGGSAAGSEPGRAGAPGPHRGRSAAALCQSRWGGARWAVHPHGTGDQRAFLVSRPGRRGWATVRGGDPSSPILRPTLTSLPEKTRSASATTHSMLSPKLFSALLVPGRKRRAAAHTGASSLGGFLTRDSSSSQRTGADGSGRCGGMVKPRSRRCSFAMQTNTPRRRRGRGSDC
jgi:hypothetical protein